MGGFLLKNRVTLPCRIRLVTENDDLVASSWYPSIDAFHLVRTSLKNPWKTLSTQTKYATPWLDAVEHVVIKPSGEPGIYGTVHFKNRAIGILPLSESGDTWIVGQFRFPLGEYSWEIPEGGAPLDEDPLEAAKRELKEETGITAGRWELILEMDMSNSTTDERAYAYLARDLTFGEAEPEADEVLEVRKLPFAELVQKVEKGEIRDALTVATVLRAARVLGG
jgi:8-oxo-dGTP pyrophosphatase MutT (NUDIX family)